MPQWGNTPLICLRCTQRLLPAGRPVLPGHSPSSIRIATPLIQARHYETDQPVNFPLIQQNLNRPARPLQSSPPADFLTPDKIAAEDQARAAEAAAAAQLKRKQKKQGIKVRYPTGGDNHTIPLAQMHPAFPRPQEPHKYATTIPPTDAQLERARAFFARGEARFVFTCESFRKFPASPLPEVAFLGRSNVGKSSLLNALFGRRGRGSPDNSDRGTAKVSNRAGKTRTMNVFVVGEGAEGGVKAPQTDMHGKPIKGVDRERWLGPGRAVAVVDMPGHGFGSKAQWGEEIIKYLTKRTQLRRVFVLVDSDHGVKSSDRQLLDLLAQNGVSHQIVLSKVDKFLLPKLTMNTPGKVQQGLMRLKKMQEAVYKELQTRERERKGTPALGEILAVSAEKAMSISEGPVYFDKVGINGLRWAILQAAGLEQPWE